MRSTATPRPRTGLNGVLMASLANGGCADDIAPGVDFFNQLNTAGNLRVDPTPATVASRPGAVRQSTGSTTTPP